MLRQLAGEWSWRADAPRLPRESGDDSERGGGETGDQHFADLSAHRGRAVAAHPDRRQGRRGKIIIKQEDIETFVAGCRIEAQDD